MSRKVMQQALEALVEINKLSIGEHAICLPGEIDTAMDALRKALAEPEQNPFGEDAERYARKLHEERESYKALFTEHKPQTTHWEGCEAVHPECRKPEQESDGISWLKRDSGYFTAPTPRKPVEFLADAMRFKVTLTQHDCKITNLPRELGGRWVALVAAEDDCHMKLAAPTPRKPLTDEEVVALFNRLCQERSAWPERRYRDFARWVERAHGITGESK